MDRVERLRVLERRVRELRATIAGDPREQARALAGLERELFELAGPSADFDGGGNLLADLHDHRKLAQRLGLDDAVREADELTGRFLADVAAAWEQSAAEIARSGSATECFDGLLRTAALHLEALSADQAGIPALESVERARLALRRRLLDELGREAPTPELRQSWTTQLLDRADIVLTSVDDLAPERAADQLNVVTRELEWHLDQVETSAGRRRRRLRRKLRRIAAERQERRLQDRLERRFGRRAVAFVEQLVLALIVLVLGLMLAEALLDLSPRTLLVFSLIDGAACAIFLSEFFVKLWMVPGRGAWFRRHFLVDFLPSIPFGLLTTGLAAAEAADAARAGRLGRLLRLPRLLRYVRVLRPLIYTLRALGLLARGFDRLARQYGHVLNHTIILYPTRGELQRSVSTLPDGSAQARRLWLELRHSWKRLLATAPDALRPEMARARLDRIADDVRAAGACARGRDQTPAPQTREMLIGDLIVRLSGMTPQDVEASLGEELTEHLARITRTFARWPLRWLPVVSSLVPRLSQDTTDAEAVALAARRAGALVRRFHGIWFWFSDLYGTVTPSQFVDRVGSMLVSSSFRPAYRLALFGGLLLLTNLLLSLTTVFEPVRNFLTRFVGTTVLVMGVISFVILAIGWWLKRVAREATEFYERSAQAQFLSLTEMIRSRSLARDAAILYDRVLRPDWLLRERHWHPDVEPDEGTRRRHLHSLGERIEHTLLKAHADADEGRTFQALENTVLLYRDWLDGALLADSDTRATSQLLGNPSVRQFLDLSCRVNRKHVKRLHVLDLERQKSLLGGPYLWFNLITRSVTHSVACLLVDYNQNAIPISELPLVDDAERARYHRWLSEGHLMPTAREADVPKDVERSYVTTAFTALHFLDFDPQRDQQVERRFGADVLRKLQSDRALLIRRIFGTYPMHDRPREQRVVNLYALYGTWLAGGRAFLVPLFLLLAGLKFAGGMLRWVVRSLAELREPNLRMRSRDAARAYYAAAVRKIDRVRRPVVDASLRLRVMLDPEYLGVPLPGESRSPLAGADVDSDLRFLRPEPQLAEEIEQERRRAEADMRRLGVLFENGLLDRVAIRLGLQPGALDTPLHHRAAAVAYLADLRGVRQHLSATEIVSEVCSLAVADPPLPIRRRPRPRLQRAFNAFWLRYGFGDDRERRHAWRATVHNLWGAADALATWRRHGDAAHALGEERLAELLLHPGRIGEQLLAVRAIQTLAVLDVLNYREHIYHLGRYAEAGDAPGTLLDWQTTLGRPRRDGPA